MPASFSRGLPMVAAVSSIHESDNHGQALLDEVVQLFTDLLNASGASMQMIRAAMDSALHSASQNIAPTRFTDLGSLLRDCMEVMCTWRRDIELVDSDGEPIALPLKSDELSFESLCMKAHCRRPTLEILGVLLEFGAVSKDANGLIRSETPTFILGRAVSGGHLATDGLLKQLEGFLLCVHRNVRSVAGDGTPKFERACTVTVAQELESVFAQLVRSRGQDFIDSIDEWLERNIRFDSPSGRYLELGAGAYYIDHGERRGRKGISK
jgi:hypothetical protein